MKTKRSILRQLLVNILVPVLLIFSLIFYLIYQYSLQKVEQEITQQKENIVEETKNLIEYYDFSMRTHESAINHYLEEKSVELEEQIRKYTPETAPLTAIQLELGMDTSDQDVYLINQHSTIINTTYKPDLGLDFSKIDKSFQTFFHHIFSEKMFKADRFGLEISTGRIRKYTYFPVNNQKYIIELGIYSKEADQFKNLLLKKIKSLNKRYQSINDVTLYMGVKKIVDVTIRDSASAKAYLQCINTEKPVSIDADNPETPGSERKEFTFLPVMDAALYSGYVLEMQTNDYVYQKLLSDLFIRFTISFILALLVIAVVVYIRSRKITRPLAVLAQKTQGITTENLGQHISISGSKELYELADSFNGMMDKLRHSYENLEEKVVERTQELQEQKLIVESKNHEIVESIQYARFIQQALLPLETEIQSGFDENAFVYYAPKDIIAGDFFWFEKRNTVSWFAVADCTGHGVPGALVSVLCINALNQALAVDENRNTGELLDQVRELVVQTLTKEARSVKDGMDISLARFDHETNILQWTGANNPLWIFRGEEILVTSPDKQPVGQFDGAKPFTTHEIQLEPNDWVILFSDGYADQFGGPKNKKYKYATFKEFILAHKNKNGSELKAELKLEFENWKGQHEQTDDVCVMGIRIT
nr:SpoIIE family protein phosphatase [uncultured Fluviicola sp.]